MTEGRKYLAALLGGAGFDCGENTLDRLDDLIKRLIEYNGRINLTAKAGYKEIARRHVLDSLHLLKSAGVSGGRMIDVGCGGGFPSLPVKIFDNTIDMICMDSTAKKLRFIETVAEEMKLDGIWTLARRAEEAAHEEAYREAYDFAVSRAVAELGKLVELCLPLVRPGGMMLAMKSVLSAETEGKGARATIKALGGEVNGRYEYALPNGEESDYMRGEAKMCIIRINKISRTPQKYPRKYAKIAADTIM